MRRAAIHRRVSTEDQAEGGAGMAAQLAACRAWAAREGYEPAGPFDDDGVSGAAPLDRRPGLMAAITSLRRGDVLLVAKRDRLGRDPIRVATAEAMVERKGARVASAAGEGTEDDGPTGVLMRRIVDAFAEYERLIIKARTRGALAAIKARGDRTGQVPYGKTVVDDGRRSKRGNLPVRLADEPAERGVLEWVHALRRAGWAYRKITWALNLRGLRTREGRPWQASTVRHLCLSHHVTKGPTADVAEPPGPALPPGPPA